MDRPHLSGRLDRVYGADDLRDLRDAYDAWASEYDTEVNRLGYLLRSVATGYVARHIPPDGRVLDAGAGTGLIGMYLGIMGYQDLFAIDLSPGMLDLAREKNCYRELREMILGGPLEFPDDWFDGAFAVGVFTEGHAPPESFPELIRVVRPGGRIVFTIREDVHRDTGFKEAQDALAEAGDWRLVEVSPRFQPYATVMPEIYHHVFAYQVTRSSG